MDILNGVNEWNRKPDATPRPSRALKLNGVWLDEREGFHVCTTGLKRRAQAVLQAPLLDSSHRTGLSAVPLSSLGLGLRENWVFCVGRRPRFSTFHRSSCQRQQQARAWHGLKCSWWRACWWPAHSTLSQRRFKTNAGEVWPSCPVLSQSNTCMATLFLVVVAMDTIVEIDPRPSRTNLITPGFRQSSCSWVRAPLK